MRIFSLLILLFLHHLSFAQTTRFQQEVNSLDSLLRKTKSFKQQIKGDRKQHYQQKKAELLVSPDTTLAWQRFLLLTKLLDLVKDNHLGFYQRVNYQLFKTREQIDSLFAADYFRDVPSVTWNLDSLKEELARKSKEDIEGIFHYGSDFNLGILKTGEQQYMGVVLESSTPYVKPGHIMAWLSEKENNRFSAIYLHPVTKHFNYYATERYANQQLMYSKLYPSNYTGIYTKELNLPDYCNLPDTASPFLLSKPMPSVQYVRVSSFSNNGKRRQQSDSLYQLLTRSEPQPTIVFDLRNNTGGAASMAKPYIKWIRQIRKKSRVIVLINAYTISQGEITAQRLSRLKGVVLAGQSTKGMLAYGSNYGRHIPIAGGEFVFYPTDMRTPGMFKFEDIGIQPDIELSNQEDWLKQVNKIWR
ncbi:hypothetical protein GCM10027036_36800 [Flavihumibacter cheonanensis]|uniref:S41 family peptidase n=1 Tax=Flavihumibacter cheonanensis TaxID=1442385 RepID=UPI001EF8B424|nr:S41 family peptidase [Flavihumibacter cheonanensis]MCG7753683.1 S41 family peptidase [Flavihumibacter cheonanensis]